MVVVVVAPIRDLTSKAYDPDPRAMMARNGRILKFERVLVLVLVCCLFWTEDGEEGGGGEEE